MSGVGLSGRPGKMLARFPSFMDAEDRGKVVASIARALGRDVDEAERLMTLIQRAHRLEVADEERDVLRLAALLGLERGDFTLLRKLYDAGHFAPEPADLHESANGGRPGDASIRAAELGARFAYSTYLSELQESVARIADVMLDGCGTVWALLEGAAIMIVADTIPATDGSVVEHVDVDLPHGGFIHRVTVDYRTSAGNADDPSYVYLVENPVVDVVTDETERHEREWFRLERGGFWDGPVAIKVRGSFERTVNPLVVAKATHEGVGYRGTIAADAEVIFGMDGHVYLGDEDVTGSALYFEGALFDDTAFDSAEAKESFVVTQPAGALDRNFPRAPIDPLDELPVVTLRLGESDWRFSVEEGAFDASAFEHAVWELPTDPALLGPLPSGAVQMAWKENTPFAASVLIPEDLRSLEKEVLDGDDLRVLVRAGLERFRPAGIDLDVDYYEPDWVVGEGILRDAAPDSAEAVFFGGTALGVADE